MIRLLGVMLGVLTATGGFVDIGDLVASALVGARFGLGLAWALLLGLLGICLFAEMSGRVAAVTGRATFDLVRERLGPRAGLANLAASVLVTTLTLAAEVGGVALAFELATSVNRLLWVPLVVLLVWAVIWRVRFSVLENLFGLLGLCLVAFAVALWQLHPDWSALWQQLSAPSVQEGEGRPTYFYYAIALLGSSMTPYEVFFFSSGGVEERWTRKDLLTERVNVFFGFPLGALLSLSIMAVAAVVFLPANVQVDRLSQTVLPVALTLGKVGLAVVLVGVFAVTFGAALETALSAGYSVAQYLGWQWGKYVRPREAARFHVVVMVALLAALLLLMTTADPVKVTEYSLVFSAMALPLTYLPILVIANDPDYMGDQVNGRLSNLLGSAVLVVIVVASLAAVPLMVLTKAGQ